jgi:hypothetical protein
MHPPAQVDEVLLFSVSLAYVRLAQENMAHPLTHSGNAWTDWARLR